MAQPSAPNSSFPPPHITPTDLEAFHKTHFSTTSIDHFSTHFLGPLPEDEAQEEEEDDGLGYYPDGVKRTLTDEQIAMFRHSEIQALLRERRHAEENSATPPRDDGTPAAEADEGELEDGDGDGDGVPAPPQPERPLPSSRVEARNACASTAAAKRQRGAEQRKGKSHGQLPKPDLRKRTWDKVDRGLQSLDYGEEERGATALPAAAAAAARGRRKISYEDV